MKFDVARRFTEEFGTPKRDVLKVKSWNISNNIGIVLQLDQPNRENDAYVWLPYPGEGQSVPEIAFEYPGEAGRHSGTYPAAGLKRGEPAMKLTIRDLTELDEVVDYIRAMASHAPLPTVKDRSERDRQSYCTPSKEPSGSRVGELIEPSLMPTVEPVKPKREAIPRLVQREVWQRDGGRCVDCGTRERLCFDHIVPFSKGGGNSVRNLQLLCENCNLSKNNRI
jgi:5-methylcytosine-specific restriction endonuclease McrA